MRLSGRSSFTRVADRGRDTLRLRVTRRRPDELAALS